MVDLSGSATRIGHKEEFHQASYAKRYEILLTKLLRERLYDGTCLLLSKRSSGTRVSFKEPSAELSFRSFASSLLAHAIAFVSTRESDPRDSTPE